MLVTPFNHVLISLTELIKNSLDNKKFGCGIFLDLQKAFDTVNHQILLDKLKNYGIRATVLAWFSSHLSNRSQYVSVNGCNFCMFHVVSHKALSLVHFCF